MHMMPRFSCKVTMTTYVIAATKTIQHPVGLATERTDMLHSLCHVVRIDLGLSHTSSISPVVCTNTTQPGGQQKLFHELSPTEQAQFAILFIFHHVDVDPLIFLF